MEVQIWCCRDVGSDAQALALGALRGITHLSALDYLHLAAETYPTLGYGGVVLIGALRLVASIEPLNGLCPVLAGAQKESL